MGSAGTAQRRGDRRRLLLPAVRDPSARAQIDVGLNVRAWPQSDGAAIGFDGLVRLARGFEGGAEVEVRFGKPWIEFQCSTVMEDRFLQIGLLLECRAEVVVGLGMTGTQRRGPPVTLHRVVELRLHLYAAPRLFSVSTKLGSIASGAVAGDRVVELSLLLECSARLLSAAAFCGSGASRTAIAGDGLVEAARLMVSQGNGHRLRGRCHVAHHGKGSIGRQQRLAAASCLI